MKAVTAMSVHLCLLLSYCVSFAQADSVRRVPSEKNEVYKVNYLLDVPITAGGYITGMIGIDLLRDRKPRDMSIIPYLNPKDVWWFDRGAARQDPDKSSRYLSRSNTLMRTFMFAPGLMFLDREVRDNWITYTMLYLEAQAINSAAYAVGAGTVRRMRPIMYNPDVSMDVKLGTNTTNSFFSGHTSVVATSTFFMVTVYYDLHPEARNKMLWYGMASVPPAIAGYFRYRAGKHFPTDIMTGFAVGAMTGILVPEWHKVNGGRFCVYPVVTDDVTGFYSRIRLD